MAKRNEAAWLSAFQKGSKQLQSRLHQMHKNNPEFQDFVKKHGFGGNLSAKQAEKQKKSSVVTVPPADTAKPEMKKGPADREAMIKAAAEKLRSRRQAAANRVAFGGELGGGFVMPHSSFRTYREHLEEQKKKLDKLGFPVQPKVQQLPAPKGGHPVPQGYERVKDNMGFNVLRKIRKEEVAYLDGYINTVKGGWVAKRNGKQIGPVVSSKDVAKHYIKQTKKGIAAKVLNALSNMKPKMATESRENRERVRSYDSAVVVSRGKVAKLTTDPKSRLKKLFNRIGPVGVKKLMALEQTEMSNKESLNELRKATLASYLQKAPSRVRAGTSLGKDFEAEKYKHMAVANKHSPYHYQPGFKKDPEKLADAEKNMDANAHLEKTFKRQAANSVKGIQRAGRLLAKEEAEQLDERNTESHPSLWDSHALVHKSGKVLEKGAKVKGFRGTYTIKGFEMPHHSGSTGRVYTDKGTFFPGVVDAKIQKRDVSVKEEVQPVNEVSVGVIAKVAQARYNQAQAALKDKDYYQYVTKMRKAMKAGDATTPKTGWTAEDDPVKKEEVVKPTYRQVREELVRRKK